jgi:hypothetical protein
MVIIIMMIMMMLYTILIYMMLNIGAKIKYVSFNANVIEVHRDDVQEFLGSNLILS